MPIYRLTAGLASDHLAPTRVVIATLVGLAVEQGYIDGVDQSVLDFFSDREIDRLSAEKEAITVEHLLTMTSGLDCEKFEDRISQSDDWVQIILDLPMEDEPGTVFGECNANTHLLSAILQQVTGVNAFAYAQTALFEPLGIEVATWRSDPLGVSLGWQGLEMDPSETAKIGLLYLRDGVWENQRLLSKDWVRSSLPAMTHSGYGGLGYQWQEGLVGIYAAGDGRGQWIVLEPEKDVIFVFTAGQREQDALSMRILLDAFLIESMHPSPL
ncbi:MAG: serine hydrolase, partial [Anaerolineales bacterium]|nr:serine hydrolase [Anaerolineales bacterium]